MTVATIFAGTNDGQLACSNATYATARSGGGTLAVDTSATTAYQGQELYSGVFYCYVYGLDFDTSAIPANAIISSAVLSLCPYSKLANNGSAPVVRARLSDWGTTLTTADWIAGASLSGLPLLAHIAQADVVTSGNPYNAFTDDAMAANIVKGGHTRMLIVSDRLEAGTAPGTGQEYVRWIAMDFTGTTYDPKLVVTYTLAVGSSQAVVVM
jgi:hypothetical protein